jgi:hypothetical protein
MDPAALVGLDPAAILASEAVEQPDGSVVLVPPAPVPDPTEAASAPDAHKANLADGVVPDDVLARIAGHVHEGILADVQSNQESYAAWQTGLKLLGLKPERVAEPFEGASGAVHPMLKQAVVAFVATANAEMCPASGPARCEIIGDVTPEIEAVAQRKEAWLNYYLTGVDEGFYPDCDQGWLMLSLYGSIFRKVYRDPLTGQPRSRFLTPLNLILSYSAEGLDGAGRVTMADGLARTEVIRRRLKGYYRDVPVAQPSGEESEQRKVAAEADLRRPSDLPQDTDHLIYECCLLLQPSEFGWQDPQAEGAPPELPLPYIVTIDHDSQAVLRMERDWRQGDPLFRPERHYTHYRWMPGLGVYGWGLLALMAASTDTASVLLRQALNAFTLNSFPGGFKVKGISGETSQIAIGPMQFAEIETGGLPIQQAIMPLVYRDVPPSFAPLLDNVQKGGEALGQISMLQVGEGRQDAPVGTTLALLEQAIRPTAAVLKRLHTARRAELRLLATMFGNPKGDARYPYLVNGKRGEAVAADFATNDDVLPVSDPNSPTQVQRLALADAKLRLALSSQGMMDLRVAYRSMLRTMGVSDAEADALLPEGGKPGVPADVVTEFAWALKGTPLAVGPTQAHEAHLVAHLAQMQIPNLPPNVMQALMAHAGEHLAALYASLASIAAGVPVIPGQPMPPEVEARVAMAVAQSVSQIMQPIAAAMAGAGQDPNKAAELEFKGRELEFKALDSVRKSTEAARQDQVEILVAQAEGQRARLDATVRELEATTALVTEMLRVKGAASKAQASAVTAAHRAAVGGGGGAQGAGARPNGKAAEGLVS